jgi:PAS domain S-box-containing protein
VKTGEDQLRAIIDTIPVLAWSAHPEGLAEFFNRRWLDYAGLSVEEARGWGWTAAVHPDDLKRLTDYWRSILASGEPGEIEARLRRFDGEYRWFLFRAEPLRDDLGNIIRWYGTNIDIEERKQAEALLAAEKRTLEMILDAIPQLIIAIGAEGNFLYANQAVWEYTGLTKEELSESHRDVFHPEDTERLRDEREAAISRRLPFEYERRVRRRDGQYRWFLAQYKPLLDERGEVIRWYATGTDIDDRKRAEEKLRRSEWNLLEAQRLGHMGSWTVDIASETLTASPELLRLAGFKPGEDHSSNDYRLKMHAEDRERVRALFRRCMNERTDFEAHYRMLGDGGAIKYMHSIGHPVLNPNGDLVEYVGAVIDTTEQTHARIALENALTEVKVLRDQLYKENLALRDEVDRVSMFEEILGTSPALQAVVSRVVKVAPTDCSVLITGETGTGKELIARAIHKRSMRSQRAFVSVNCAALAPSLISSELFGHEKGAFTGATQRRLGRFELANGGTIFLDEIGELPAETQVALLRVLQEREFERVGGTQSIQVDVRMVAATNRNLKVAIANGTFRSDLFYRLNVFPIQMPPLRERKDDILALLEYFVQRFGRKLGKNFSRIDKRTVELFRSYDWPGNVRELQNVVERSVIVSPDHVFCVDEAWLFTDAAKTRPGHHELESTNGDSGRERQIIEAALAESGGRVYGTNGAAAKLRIPPSTLDFKIKKLKICKNHFKRCLTQRHK